MLDQKISPIIEAKNDSYVTTITDVSTDPMSGAYTFSVIFDYGQWQSESRYVYTDQQQAQDAHDKATADNTTITPSSLNTMQLENIYG